MAVVPSVALAMNVL